MNTAHGAARLEQTFTSTRHVSGFFWRCWEAFRQRRERRRLRAALYELNDAELQDIGIARGEIDYVASNRSIDPRGARSAEWVQYLPTVDGQMGPIDFR